MKEFLKAARIPDIIRHCESRGIICEWYLFGSVAAGQGAPSDIDVLLICDDQDSLDCVQDEIMHFLLLAPIHLVAMTSQEEQALNFKDAVSAIAIKTKQSVIGTRV